MLQNESVPVYRDHHLHPFGKDVAHIYTNYTNFVAGQPDPSAFDIPNLKCVRVLLRCVCLLALLAWTPPAAERAWSCSGLLGVFRASVACLQRWLRDGCAHARG